MKKFLFIILLFSALLYFLIYQPSDLKNVLLDDQSVGMTDTQTADLKIESAQSSIDSSLDLNQKLNSNKLQPEIQEALELMLDTSSEGLSEEVTDKGVSVDLRGRFQTVPVATINEQGELEIQDYSSKPIQRQP